MKLGEFELNKIYCMDCLEGLKKIPDNSVDLVVTDPPYGIDLDYNGYEDTEDNWFKLMDKVIPELRRIAKMVIMPSCQIKRLKWIYNKYSPDWLICWYKGSTGHSSFIGFNDWEPHLVYGRTKNQLFMHDFFKTKPSPKKMTFNHPCPKPIEWARWLIERASDKGMIILDCFMGSGTTALACKQLGRNFIGFEINPEYVKIANKRLSQEVLKF